MLPTPLQQPSLGVPPHGKGIVVHEWLAETGGSENVFQAMADALPDADLLCLWSDAAGRADGRAVAETWLARTPLRNHKAAALPMMPTTWRGRRGGPYDWALVSTHLFAHHVSFAKQDPGFRKYLYVHSPARYLWEPEVDGRASAPLLRPVTAALRRLDRHRASEAHAIAVNSAFVQARVARAWGRASTVIHPPVEVERIRATHDWSALLTATERTELEDLPTQYVLGASRFVPYKRLDLVIEAANESRIPAVIAGAGPDETRLRQLASHSRVPVAFVRSPSDAMLYALYQRASCFVFPAVEDFGIMPVEALAAGTPVVTGPMGGAREIIESGVSGEIAEVLSPSAVSKAIDRAQELDPTACTKRAELFSRKRFDERLVSWLAAPES